MSYGIWIIRNAPIPLHLLDHYCSWRKQKLCKISNLNTPIHSLKYLRINYVYCVHGDGNNNSIREENNKPHYSF